MTDIDALIEAVEAGESPPVMVWFGALGDDYYHGRDAYRGSLDAARSLHDALLPGWTWAIQNDAANVIFTSAEAWRVWDVPVYSAECKGNPARSWLLAILRAVKAKG